MAGFRRRRRPIIVRIDARTGKVGAFGLPRALTVGERGEFPRVALYAARAAAKVGAPELRKLGQIEAGAAKGITVRTRYGRDSRMSERTGFGKVVTQVLVPARLRDATPSAEHWGEAITRAGKVSVSPSAGHRAPVRVPNAKNTGARAFVWGGEGNSVRIVKEGGGMRRAKMPKKWAVAFRAALRKLAPKFGRRYGIYCLRLIRHGRLAGARR